MKEVDYIALAIPVFFLLIAIEAIYAKLAGKRLYRLNDSLNDLACGILQQVLGVFSRAIVFGVYAWLWERARLAELDPRSAWVWVGCFLGVDFFYYWFHRWSHESNLPWGAHAVHHQSEEYNLTVALRQGAFQPLFSWTFYLPLALAGFPPLVFLACSSFNTLYQFWIHTRAIGRLGPLEWVFNTPSHHRVHHGANPKYIDKNHGGTLIIWDRLFGTFVPEQEEPTYGLTKPLRSWNPLWANVQHWVDVWRLAKRAPSFSQWLRTWVAGPGWAPVWAPDGLGHPDGPTPLTAGEAGKYDARATPAIHAYAVVHFALAAIALTALLELRGRLSTGVAIAWATAIVWTLTDLGALFERKRWARAAEALRLLVVGAAAAGTAVALDLSGPTAWITGAVGAFAVLSIGWLWRVTGGAPTAGAASPSVGRA